MEKAIVHDVGGPIFIIYNVEAKGEKGGGLLDILAAAAVCVTSVVLLNGASKHLQHTVIKPAYNRPETPQHAAIRFRGGIPPESDTRKTGI